METYEYIHILPTAQYSILIQWIQSNHITTYKATLQPQNQSQSQSNNEKGTWKFECVVLLTWHDTTRLYSTRYEMRWDEMRWNEMRWCKSVLNIVIHISLTVYSSKSIFYTIHSHQFKSLSLSLSQSLCVISKGANEWTSERTGRRGRRCWRISLGILNIQYFLSCFIFTCFSFSISNSILNPQYLKHIKIDQLFSCALPFSITNSNFITSHHQILYCYTFRNGFTVHNSQSVGK